MFSRFFFSFKADTVGGIKTEKNKPTFINLLHLLGRN